MCALKNAINNSPLIYWPARVFTETVVAGPIRRFRNDRLSREKAKL